MIKHYDNLANSSTALRVALTDTASHIREQPRIMAKGKRERAEVEHYASDDGFVEDAPKSKKTKATNTKSNGEGGTSVFPVCHALLSHDLWGWEAQRMMLTMHDS